MKVIGHLSFLLIAVIVTGCDLIGDIFSAGFYTALVLVALVLIVIVWIVVRLRRK